MIATIGTLIATFAVTFACGCVYGYAAEACDVAYRRKCRPDPWRGRESERPKK